MLRKLLLVCAFVLSFVPICAMAVPMAQSQIRGHVTDSKGNAVPNTKVVIRDSITGQAYEVTTDQNGEFVIPNVQTGTYILQGPTSTNGAPIQIVVGTSGLNDVSIQLATNGQVEVRAETQTEDRSTANINTNFSDIPIALLPQPNALNRSGQYFGAYNLSLLGEGVTPGYAFQNGVGPSVGGQPNTSNNFLVNGTDNNNQAVPGPLVTVTNEASTEFSLMQGQQMPQYGHTTGGQMNTILTDGTNAWHGGVYGYFNNRKLNAVEPTLRGQRTLRYDQNRFGAKAGGPLMRNTLFGFADFEYLPLRTEQPLLNPTLAPTGAGFATLSGIPGVSARNLSVLQNNLVVSENTVATTTVNGVTIPLGLVNTGARINQDQYNGIANLDWHVGAASDLGVRYVHNDIGTNAFGSALPAFAVPGHTRSMLGAINYSATPSGTFAFNLNGGYNRLDQNIGGGNSVFPGLSSFPNITIQGLGVALGPEVGVGRTRTNMYQGSGMVDWHVGSHELRFGADVRRLISVFGNFGSGAGNFTFSSLQRFLLDLPPDVGGLQTFGASFSANRTLVHPYIQDNFKFRGLDLELGLGYEYSTIPQSLRVPSQLAALSVPGLIQFNEPQTQTWNFEPRIGIAWSPKALSHTVVRGGFGLLYDALYNNSSLLSPTTLVRTTTSAATSTPGFFTSGIGIAPTLRPGSVGAFAFDQTMPYIIHWNGAVSHGFGNGRLATEFKYMGHHGVSLPLESILNDSRVSAAESLPVFFTNPGLATLNTLPTTQTGLATASSPFVAAGFTNPIFTLRPDGNSWYNAGSIKISETFTAGTQIAAQYTYSDARANATGTPLDLGFGRRMEQVPWNQKHRATITPILDIASMLPRSTGMLREVVANLSLMGTVTYARGGRMPLFSAIDTGMNGSSIGSGVFVNPNGVAGVGSGVVPLTNSSGQTVAFLAANPSAQIIAGAPGTFSTERPTVRLGDTRNLDVSLVKRFTVPDRAKIEVRGDAFNLLNHPQFTGLQVSSLGTGLFTTPGFLLPDSPLFGDLTRGLSGNPRTIQLALRILF